MKTFKSVSLYRAITGPRLRSEVNKFAGVSDAELATGGITCNNFSDAQHFTGSDSGIHMRVPGLPVFLKWELAVKLLLGSVFCTPPAIVEATIPIDLFLPSGRIGLYLNYLNGDIYDIPQRVLEDRLSRRLTDGEHFIRGPCEAALPKLLRPFQVFHRPNCLVDGRIKFDDGFDRVNQFQSLSESLD